MAGKRTAAKSCPGAAPYLTRSFAAPRLTRFSLIYPGTVRDEAVNKSATFTWRRVIPICDLPPK